MIELSTFGSLEFRDAAAGPMERLLAQPKRAALLTYLMLARPRGFHRRDELLAIFWPENDAASARSALSRSLSFLRSELPERVILTRGMQEIGVAAESVRADVVLFERAIAREDHSQAMEYYRGPFLHGFHLGAVPDFDRWMEAERERLREEASRVAWLLARSQIEAGHFTDAERTAQRALTWSPTDESAVRDFLLALAPGDRAAAVRFYERFAAMLREDLDLEPSPQTMAVVESIRGPVDSQAGTGPAAGDAANPERPLSLDVSAGWPALPRPGDDFQKAAKGPGRRRALLLAGGAIGVLVTALAWLLMFRISGVEEAEPPRRLAVLPFEAVGLPPGDSVLPRALTMEVIRHLSRVKGLEVTDWLAVKNLSSSSREAVLQAGRSLGADAVLVGTLLGSADRVRAAVRLVVPRTGTVLWSEAIDRSREEIVYLQTDIASETVRRLRVRLAGVEQAGLALPPTGDTAAYRLYLLGRKDFDALTPTSLARADAELREAIARDSTFALAHTWLGLVHLLSMQVRAERGVDTWPIIVRHANLALALDSTVAEAYVLLGYVRHAWDWDWGAAEPMFRRAVALDPSDFHARIWLSQYLDNIGQHEEALRHARHAQRLNPTSPYAAVVLSGRFYYNERWKEAERWAAAALDLDEDFWVGYWLQGIIAVARGAPARAVAPLRQANQLCGGGCADGTLARAFAALGRMDSVRAIFRREEGLRQQGRVSPTILAEIRVALGQPAEFCGELERAWEERDVMLPYLVSADWHFVGRGFDDTCVRRLMERAGAGKWFRPAGDLPPRVPGRDGESPGGAATNQ